MANHALTLASNLGRETFVYCVIAIFTLIATAVSGNWATVASGIGLASIYMIWLEIAERRRLRERYLEIEKSVMDKAEALIEANATPSELNELQLDMDAVIFTKLSQRSPR